MSCCKLMFCILLVIIYATHIECTDVEFSTPDFIRKNIPYNLYIRNSNPKEKFPVDNFVIAIELLKELDPRVELGVAAILGDTYKGDEYRAFSIKDFFIYTDHITMKVEFRREAHDAWFRVRYTSAKTDIDKEEFYGKNPNSHIIFKKKIQMLLPYTITLQASHQLHEIEIADKQAIGDVLLSGKIGQLKCHATDGLPNPSPEFLNKIDLPGATVNNVNNDITLLAWTVRPEDHGKTILCRAGNDIGNITLKVYHYLTNVSTLPLISDTMSGGTQIKCINENGFPVPTMSWKFLSGPPNAAYYYELMDNNSTLQINETAPLQSNWSFQCTGSSAMPSVVAKYLVNHSPNYSLKKIYNFTIIVTKEPGLLNQASNTGLVIVLTLFIIAVIAVIAGYFNREKILQFIQDHSSRTGQVTENQANVAEPIYKYSEIKQSNLPRNGTDKDDGVCYAEIVATVQPKTSYPNAPIDNV